MSEPTNEPAEKATADEAVVSDGVTAGDVESTKVTTPISGDPAVLVPGPTGQQSAHEGGTTTDGKVQQQA